MSKYKVTQRFMTCLNKWKQANFNDDFMFVNEDTIADFSEVIDNWWHSDLNDRERNKRLVAIINWINGEDVFEVGTPKYVVQRKDAVLSGVHQYLNFEQNGNVHLIYGLENATRFDDFEKASEWYNKHFEVVKIDENEL